MSSDIAFPLGIVNLWDISLAGVPPLLICVDEAIY